MNQEDKINTLLQHLGISKENIEVNQESDVLRVSVTATDDEKGLLIGRHAQTLEALQRILSYIINNTAQEHQRILLDIGDYRKERLKNIIEKAQQVAERVKTSQKPLPLPNLSSTERRQVHMYFAKDEKLTTFSQGEGEERRLFIAPRTE